MDSMLIIFAVIFCVAFVLILITSLFVGNTVFRIFRTTIKQAERQNLSGDSDTPSDVDPRTSSRHHRVLEMLRTLPPGTDPMKCGNCGATVDSTAEISPTGDIKCNYCHSRTNLFR